MQIKFPLTALLLMQLLLWGCAYAGESKESDNILSITNNAKNLTIDIHLDPDFYKEFKIDKDKIAAQEITLKNPQEKWLRFNALDHESLRSSKGYYSQVWSPDYNYLVLPLGRFEGFAIFTAPYLQNHMERLVTKQYYGADLVPETTLKIFSEFGPALWHEFVGWEGEHTLIIRVGLGNDLKKFWYNIKDNRLNGHKNWGGRVTQSQILVVEPPK